jgi:alpha-N-acetylglucosaminidase
VAPHALRFAPERLSGAEFFSGPAFFAWQRMGNIRGWGGPLPNDFIAAQAELQKKILARMLALGMVPVLPAFAGHVPKAFAQQVRRMRSRDAAAC